MDDLSVDPVLLNIEQIELPLLSRLYAYWRERCQGRVAPSRADIDPTELTYILPRLLMFDVLDDGVDFRVRLAGSGTYNLHGQDITGMLLSDFRPLAFQEAVMASYRQIVRDRQPLYLRNVYRQYGIEIEAYHVLRLPLSEDGGAGQHHPGRRGLQRP